MTTVLARLYRAIPRPLVRALLWAAHDKFNLGAVALLRTPEGRVLVVKHVYRHRYPWALPGGYLHRGEAPAAGCLRELGEETGLAAVLDGICAVEEVDAFQREVVFAGRVDPAQPFTLNHELAAAGYFAPDALPDDMLPRHAALVRRIAGPA
jgi:ADP-ribose pyrophosphatase YjhB (NUDIX family)